MGSSIVCPLHDKPVSFLNLSANIPLEQRVLCSECDPENTSLTNLEDAMKKWQLIETKMISKFSSFKQQKIDQLQSLSKLFSNYREAVLQSINAVQETIDDYKNQFARALDREIQYIKQISEDINFQKLIDIAVILSDRLMEQESENDHIGNLNLENILKKEKLLFQELKKQNILIQQETVKIIAQNQDDIKPKPINYQLLQTIKQGLDCFAISFNKDSSLMISGSGKDIKVWNVENEKFNNFRTLEGHNYNINTLCFSGLSNFFLSGGCDNQVRIWNSKGDWKCDQVLNEHNNSVCCIILNKSESQFYSSGLDNFIKVYQKNDEKWVCVQQLIGHSGSVYCITLNDSQKQLVSCSRDKSIIVWEIDENQQWLKKQQIINDDYGYRICFISKNTFVWQKYGTGETIIYQFDNSEQQYSVIKSINLKTPTMDGHYLFPSVYNSNNQILIQKHSKYLYVIRKLQNNKYAALQTIEFSSSSSFGTLCSNGDIMAVWNDRKKEIQIWKNQ